MEYKLRVTTNVTEVENFVNNSRYQNFMQLPQWGSFKSLDKQWQYKMVVLEAGETIVGSAMILIRKVPILKKHVWYIPRGFVVDYQDLDLVTVFAQELRMFAKKNGAFVVKIDPLIKAYDNDMTGVRTNGGDTGEALVATLNKAGFKHQGYVNSLKDSIQPRNTLTLDLTKPTPELEKNLNKSVRTDIKYAKKSGIEVNIGDRDDISKLYEMLSKTAAKSNFLIRNLSYYQKLYDELAPHGYAKLYYATFRPKLLATNAKRLYEVAVEDFNAFEKRAAKQKVSAKKLASKKAEVEQARVKYEKMKAQYGEDRRSFVVCSTLMIYTNKTASYIFGGSDLDYLKYKPTQLVQWEMILDAKAKGKELYDFMGVLTTDKNDPEYGVYLFKTHFADAFLECVGEFDAIISRVDYCLYRSMLLMHNNIRKPLIKFLKRK